MKKAFSLIEILIILTIILLTTGFSLAYYNSYTQELILKNQAKKLVDVFELAKKKAESSELMLDNGNYCQNFNGYRLKIYSNNYQLFYICENIERLVINENFQNKIIFINNNQTIDFLPLNKQIFNNLTFTLKNQNINKCIDININELGVITLNDTLYSC